MPEIFHELVFHFIFVIKDREPVITPPLERVFLGNLRQTCQELGYELHEIGGTEDHIHLLLSLRPSDRIDVVVDTLKNAGAELINKLALGKTLKWEEGYGVLSLRNKDIEIVSDYIRTQKERHKKGDLIAKMEKTK